MQKKRIQRQYKDRLFRMAFREKRHLLELYNAVNGSHYTDPELLEIRTLEDVIYMGMKNDAAFMLDHILNLWEHQSSFNPNMPLRSLSYFARLYQNYIDENEINVYSSKLQRVPFPQYIVFYNGKRDEPDRMELRLSDAFWRSDKIPAEMMPCLEIRAIMLNINWGHNREIMDQCKRLGEYARCIALIRQYEEESRDREEAVMRAVDQCIAEGLLSDILKKNRAEVMALFLTEYDEQKHLKLERAEAREEGRSEGRYISLIGLVRKKTKRGMNEQEIADFLEESPQLIRRICDAVREHPDWTDVKLYEEGGISF